MCCLPYFNMETLLEGARVIDAEDLEVVVEEEIYCEKAMCKCSDKHEGCEIGCPEIDLNPYDYSMDEVVEDE